MNTIKHTEQHCRKIKCISLVTMPCMLLHEYINVCLKLQCKNNLNNKMTIHFLLMHIKEYYIFINEYFKIKFLFIHVSGVNLIFFNFWIIVKQRLTWELSQNMFYHCQYLKILQCTHTCKMNTTQRMCYVYLRYRKSVSVVP